MKYPNKSLAAFQHGYFLILYRECLFTTKEPYVLLLEFETDIIVLNLNKLYQPNKKKPNTTVLPSLLIAYTACL